MRSKSQDARTNKRLIPFSQRKHLAKSVNSIDGRHRI